MTISRGLWHWSSVTIAASVIAAALARDYRNVRGVAASCFIRCALEQRLWKDIDLEVGRAVASRRDGSLQLASCTPSARNRRLDATTAAVGFDRARGWCRGALYHCCAGGDGADRQLTFRARAAG